MSELTDVRVFRHHLIGSGYVLDREGFHSEFVDGMHGQKLDFDNIDEAIDPLYGEWIDVNQDFIEQAYHPLPEIIIGVANGANRVALDTARRFNGEVIGLTSVKEPENSKIIYLSRLAKRAITKIVPRLVVVIEDVSTTGSSSVQVAIAARDAGAKKVEVLTTWKRRERLEHLDEAEIPYNAIIDEPMPTYTPKECQELGFCALQWQLNEYIK